MSYSVLVFYSDSLVCCLEKGWEKQHICRLYCLPPFNGTLSRTVLTTQASQCVCVRVCWLSLVSCIPNIFIDIFVCCSHLGPPWVSINLRCHPRPHVSWPFFGLSLLPRRLYNTLVTSHISSCLLCNNKHSIRGCPFPLYDAQEELVGQLLK